MTSSEHLAAIVASSRDAIVAFALDGTITVWNPAAERLFGHPAPDVLGRPAHEALPSEWGADVIDLLERVRRGGQIDGYETACRRPDGTSVVVSLTVGPTTGEGGEVVGASVVARDVTERGRAERVLSDETRILEMIASGENLGATLDAVASLIERHSAATACSILLLEDDGATLRYGGGLRLPGIERRRIEALGADPPVGPYGTAAMMVADVVTDPCWCKEFGKVAESLGVRTCWAPPILAPGSVRVLGTFALYYPEAPEPGEADSALLDRVTHLAALAVERDRTMAHLAHRATHDPLTGAGNRVLILERLGRALAERARHGSSLAVLFVDLDGFKTLNDSHGHDVGDDVLVTLAARLKGILRAEDSLARLGGDEFVVLCEHLAGELEAVGVAERVARAVAEPFPVEDSQVVLTASIGIAFPRGPDSTAQALLEQADAAMYQAKKHGKARWQVFDRAMHRRALSRLHTERALRGALAEGQFRLLYQPLVQLSTGDIVGAEALLRWEHPERGLLAPAAFMRAAEASGLIVPIGTWVLQEASRQAARWRRGAEDYVLPVHVNVSACQLGRGRFPDVVRSALAETGTPPTNFCLEVAEAVLTEDGRSAMGTLEALKALGVSLSIDDFGNGYSSLAHLSRLPIDEVKVDRRFLEGLGRRDQLSTIVGAVLSLARSLNVDVVGARVETAEQVQRLREMGCERAQGYYWGLPVEPEKLTLQQDRLLPNGHDIYSDRSETAFGQG